MIPEESGGGGESGKGPGPLGRLMVELSVIEAPFWVTTTMSRLPASVALRLLGGAPLGPVPQNWISERISERRQRH